MCQIICERVAIFFSPGGADDYSFLPVLTVRSQQCVKQFKRFDRLRLRNRNNTRRGASWQTVWRTHSCRGWKPGVMDTLSPQSELSQPCYCLNIFVWNKGYCNVCGGIPAFFFFFLVTSTPCASSCQIVHRQWIPSCGGMQRGNMLRTPPDLQNSCVGTEQTLSNSSSPQSMNGDVNLKSCWLEM